MTFPSARAPVGALCSPHRANILKKVNVRNTAELARYAALEEAQALHRPQPMEPLRSLFMKPS